MRSVSKLAAQQPTKSMPDRDTPKSAQTTGWSVFDGNNGQGIVEVFELLRGKMITYFEVRHCTDPDELADETLERLMRKLCEGAEVPDLARYAYGIAKNVFLEYLRRERAKERFVDALNRSDTGTTEHSDDANLREQHLECLDGCLSRLSEQRRWMLLEYYKHKGQAKLEHRKKMAEQLNITREALALRVFHLKRKLKTCLNECLENIRA